VVRSHRGRDDGPFVAAFEREREAVLRLAYALVGDAGVAEELAAEAFARTYERWSRDLVRDIGPYVRQAVVNHARDHFRRLDRRRRFEVRRTRETGGTTALVDDIADRDHAGRLLRGLPPRQRAALVLRYWADYSDAQVAEALGVPLGTAKSLLRRGLKRLEGRATSRSTLAPTTTAEGREECGDGQV
jgi:RNA polymerase sigma factor (sigma-70 family)